MLWQRPLWEGDENNETDPGAIPGLGLRQPTPTVALASV